jgi:hypothetical protein
MHTMIVEDERLDGRNEHIWDFQGELVAPIPGASSCGVTDNNMTKRLQKDLIDH